MHSIKEIYIIGNGPSSSHTMGPSFACDYILKKYKDIKEIKVTLCGSLAYTGKGHLTDYIIDEKLKDIKHSIEFDYLKEVKHPNTMIFLIKNKDGSVIEEQVLSIGGGSIITSDSKDKKDLDIYPHHTMKEIYKYCKDNSINLYQYIKKFEDKDIEKYIDNVLKVMEEAVSRGAKAEGYLPGNLHIKRKAKDMKEKIVANDSLKNDETLAVLTAAYAVAEENACGGIISTAPTCGSAGVIPGVIYFLKYKKVNREDIIKYLMIAGLIGIVVKTDGSVSGAECGCQAEIGVACAMAAGMLGAYYNFDNVGKIIQSAEIGLEHSLGLTCDPVGGYVQIPCIERCAIFAMKAVNAAKLALLIPHHSTKVGFDLSVETMLETGKDMPKEYRETSIKGLAKTLKTIIQ